MSRRVTEAVDADFKRLRTMIRRWEKLYDEFRYDSLWEVIDQLHDVQRAMHNAEEDVENR